MKKKNLFALLLTTILCISFLIPSVWAGSKQRHRWQGVAIGLGTAILGNAIFKHYHNEYYSHRKPSPVVAPGYNYHPPKYGRHRGYWEVRKEWIRPTYKKDWNPGRYNRRGKWVPGHWIEIEVRPGCWTETRVWVVRR